MIHKNLILLSVFKNIIYRMFLFFGYLRWYLTSENILDVKAPTADNTPWNFQKVIFYSPWNIDCGSSRRDSVQRKDIMSTRYDRQTLWVYDFRHPWPTGDRAYLIDKRIGTGLLDMLANSDELSRVWFILLEIFDFVLRLWHFPFAICYFLIVWIFLALGLLGSFISV